MKKSDQKIIGIGIVGLLLLVMFGGSFDLLSSAPGFGTVLSISEINMQSSDPILDGKVWVVNFMTGGLNQRLMVFNASSSEMNKYGVNTPFELIVDSEKQECSYDQENIDRYTPIYTFSHYVEQADPLCKLIGQCDDDIAKLKAACSAGGEQVFLGRLPVADGFSSLTNHFYCVAKKKNTIAVGSLSVGNPNIETEISMTNSVESASGVISTAELIKKDYVYLETDSGKTLGYVKLGLVGVAAHACPTARDYLMITTNDKQVKLTDRNKYSVYETAYHNIVDPDGIQDDVYYLNSEITIQKLSNAIDAANNAANDALKATSFTTPLGTGAIHGGAIPSLTLTMSTDVVVPSFVAYLKGDFLKVITPVPIPEIVNSSITETQFEGEIVTATVEVKNVGETGGEMIAKLVCYDGIEARVQPLSELIAEGDTHTFVGIAKIAHTLDCENARGYCVFEVSTSIGPSKDTPLLSDKLYTLIECKQVCVQGERACVESKLYECNEAGTKIDKLVEDCADRGLPCNPDTFSCEEVTPSPIQGLCPPGFKDVNEACGVTGKPCVPYWFSFGDGVCDIGEEEACPKDCEDLSWWGKFTHKLHLQTLLCGQQTYDLGIGYKACLEKNFLLGALIIAGVFYLPFFIYGKILSTVEIILGPLAKLSLFKGLIGKKVRRHVYKGALAGVPGVGLIGTWLLTTAYSGPIGIMSAAFGVFIYIQFSEMIMAWWWVIPAWILATVIVRTVYGVGKDVAQVKYGKRR